MLKKIFAGSFVLFAFCVYAGSDFPINLSKNVNMGFKDEIAGDGKGGWSDQGSENDFATFDFTRKKYEGIVFSIINPADNGGKSVVTFDSPHAGTGLKETSVSIPENSSAVRFLYLLHTSCWNQQIMGTPIGYVEVLFADGSGIQKEIRAGIDVSDWWGAGSGSNSVVVVKKPNKSSQVGVFLSRLDLCAKNKRVESVTFKSYGNVVWIVVGATLSPRMIYLDDHKVTFSANDKWKAVDMSDIKVKAGSALDLSGVFEPGPAGKHGRFIIGKDGILAFEDSPDVPRRLFGFNGLFHTIGKLYRGAKKDRHALIEQYAILCRRQGYNMVRPLCLVDRFLMKTKAAMDCDFDESRLDLADKLIAELKRQGVYTYLDISYERMGRKKPFISGKAKLDLLMGNKRGRYLWQKIAETLMARVNPYTGIAWKDEPAIACIEFCNEQEGVYLGWLQKSPAFRKDVVSKAVDPAWRKWLLARYKTPEALSKAWCRKITSINSVTIPDRIFGPAPENNDYGIFWRERTKETIAWCTGVLRKAGYKGLISQIDVSKLILDSRYRWECVPVVTMHNYFAHPLRLCRVGSTCRQDSSVGSVASYWREINATRLADRPFIVTEHNHGFWNPYQHEDGLLFGGYSAFQGFSGVTVHEDAVDWSLTEPVWDFGIAGSPIGRANEFIAACLFRRGDIKRAPHRVELQIPPQFTVEKGNGNKAVNSEQSKIGLMTGFSIAFPGLKTPSEVPVLPHKPDLTIGPVGGSQVEGGYGFSNVKDSGSISFKLPALVKTLKQKGLLSDSNISKPESGIFQTETGEITLRVKENLIKVVTAKTEGVSLEAGKQESLNLLKVKDSSVPACVAACAIDGKDLASSRRVVFIYSTQVANSGMELSEDRATLRKLGKRPALMRCGKLKAELKLDSAGKWALYALGINGSRREKLSLESNDGYLNISIDTGKLKNGPTPFFELITE